MQFIVHMKEIFSTIIALVCHVPFLIPTVFHSLPYLELPKVCTCITGVVRHAERHLPMCMFFGQLLVACSHRESASPIY